MEVRMPLMHTCPLGEGTGKGVIHGLTPHTPAETLMANLRIRTQGVEILRARMLGDTKTAVVTFYGPTIPRYVYYMGGELFPSAHASIVKRAHSALLNFVFSALSECL